MDVWLLIYRDGCMSVKIRVSIQVTVRSQDPKPKKAHGKEHKGHPIISSCNTVLVPAQKRSPPARSARLYFFLGRWQTTLVGGPQSTQPSWHLYTCWFRVTSFPFFSGSHGNGTSPRHPIDTCTHDIRYTCPGSSSGLMTFNGGDGVPWSRHQPWYIYCHFLPIESMITFGLQCQ